MNPRWSGPGRALQVHNRLFELVDDSLRTLGNLPASTPVDSRVLPASYQQRARLMTSMYGMILAEGDTVAVHQDVPGEALSRDNLAKTNTIFALEHGMLDRAETHYVSERVMNAILEAAESAEPETLFPTDLPCPSGLIVLEYPILLNDLHPATGVTVPGLMMPVRAIGWFTDVITSFTGEDSSVDDGIVYILYTSEDDYQQFYVPSLRTTVGPEWVVSAHDGLPYFVSDFSGWSFNKAWGDGGDVDKDELWGTGTVVSNVAYIRRFLFAYFRWTFQRILVHRHHRPNRAENKQTIRAGRRLAEPGIKIVLLRREYDFEAKHGRPASDAEFRHDHQWIVRGHWRRQWYPSFGPARNTDGSFNNDSHRLIWIDPFVAGNPFGPLVVSHNVTASVR